MKNPFVLSSFISLPLIAEPNRSWPGIRFTHSQGGEVELISGFTLNAEALPALKLILVEHFSDE